MNNFQTQIYYTVKPINIELYTGWLADKLIGAQKYNVCKLIAEKIACNNSLGAKTLMTN